MAYPIITSVIPTESNNGDIGVSIIGTDLAGSDYLYLELIKDNSYYYIQSQITFKSYREIRFKVPDYISGSYNIQVYNTEGSSNVF